MSEEKPYKSGALYVPRDKGKVKWVSGDEYVIKASGRETNGSLGFIHATVPVGNGPIAHVHNNHDEAFYLLEGELEFLDGDERFIAEAGDFVFVPRGVRHRFKNISSVEAKMNFLFTPSGTDEFFLVHGDDPLPGHKPELWTPEHFTPEMIAMAESIGDVVIPE